ncbi:MAG: methyltransferase [Bacteroidales bacterium]
MTFRNRVTSIPATIYDYCILLISMAGFVPKHATVPRIIAIASSIAFSMGLAYYYPDNATFGVTYFIISEILYLGFIFSVLSENGYRHWFIKRWKNEEEGYLTFEAILGFVFFHNAASLGFVASSSPGSLFDFINKELLFITVILIALTGFIIKIWSAKVVSIDIYYWKDMFLEKKITEFVETGPYKFLNNPMYGIGQLQAYAFAIWYGSATGLIAAAINQILIFTFYYTVEKKFIRRIYQSNGE